MNYAHVLLLMLQGASSASTGYSPLGRVQYVASAMAAIVEADPEFIISVRSYLDLLERSSCRSARASLRSRCFSVAASRRCRALKGSARAACGQVVDVMVTAKLAEHEFIPQRKRYKLMMQSNNYREAFRARLRQIMGRLTTAFALSSYRGCGNKEWTCFATHIDSYCIERAGSHHLSWHYCAATLAMFIGTGADVPGPTWEEE